VNPQLLTSKEVLKRSMSMKRSLKKTCKNNLITIKKKWIKKYLRRQLNELREDVNKLQNETKKTTKKMRYMS
jgi:hypothetical protein